MNGSDASRFVKSLRSSLAGARKPRVAATSQRPAVGTVGNWRNQLALEQARLDAVRSQFGQPVSTRRPSSALSLQQVMDTLSPLVQPRNWVEAVGSLRSGSRLKGVRPASAAPERVEGLVPSQFDPSISPAEAKAACGPAAAVAFARASGKDVSMRQAVDLARTVGWTVSGGMNGVANQKRLLDKMGIPSVLDTSGDWNKIAATASAGTPVTISTPGHYFVADGYDPQTQRFHVGSSGTAYQGGKEWMTRQEMELLAGRVNGALVLRDRSRWMA